MKLQFSLATLLVCVTVLAIVAAVAVSVILRHHDQVNPIAESSKGDFSQPALSQGDYEASQGAPPLKSIQAYTADGNRTIRLTDLEFEYLLPFRASVVSKERLPHDPHVPQPSIPIIWWNLRLRTDDGTLIDVDRLPLTPGKSNHYLSTIPTFFQAQFGNLTL